MTTNRSCSLLAPILLIAAASLPARADVELLTQLRTASARGYDSTGTLHEASWIAPDWNPASVALEPVTSGAYGYVSHTSALHPGLITTQMHAEGTHFIQSWDGSGATQLDLTFQVAAETGFQLVGDWFASYANTRSLIELSGPGVALKYENQPASGIEHGTFDQWGVLVPGGEYRLLVRLSTTGSRGIVATGEGDINLRMYVPAPATASLAGLVLLGSARRRRA